jgi:hypothetical protein
MKIFKSKNPRFFPGGIVEWVAGVREAYMEEHPSAAQMLGDKPGEVVEFDSDEAAQFAVDGKGRLIYG